MYRAKILVDSISQAGSRLTTMEITYPRFVHSELLTHRMFSRNSASSRAIPIKTMINNVLNDPVFPVWWGHSQAGMRADSELSNGERQICMREWLEARDTAVKHVRKLNELNLHKQVANRILEPWMWITVIISATDWDNFFALRCHPDAQPELQHIAYMMRDLYNSSKPNLAEVHLPLLQSSDISLDGQWDILKQICTGRCARVSYLTHDGKRDLQADIDLCQRLRESGHWSPFEHIATAQPEASKYYANFKGWMQYRHELTG